jgi:hypothetical protein
MKIYKKCMRFATSFLGITTIQREKLPIWGKIQFSMKFIVKKYWKFLIETQTREIAST